MKLFFLMTAVVLPVLLPARNPATLPRPGTITPPANTQATPIMNYGKPVIPEIPAKQPLRPPAQKPPYNQIEKPPKPLPPKPFPPKPKPPKPNTVVTVYPAHDFKPTTQYTYAWYKDGYVILYKGWFWYKKQWIWGGQGKAPDKPLWIPK